LIGGTSSQHFTLPGLELGSAREWVEGRTESVPEGQRHDRSQQAELDVGKIKFKVSVKGSPEKAAKTWLTCVHHWRDLSDVQGIYSTFDGTS
jgi:hypothetical protein